MGVSERSRMRKCKSAAHVVPATEMRGMKAASAMEMAPTMASATMTTATVTTAAVASATSAQRGTRQHDRQRNNHSPNGQF
jgi:hypothetical protein